MPYSTPPPTAPPVGDVALTANAWAELAALIPDGAAILGVIQVPAKREVMVTAATIDDAITISAALGLALVPPSADTDPLGATWARRTGGIDVQLTAAYQPVPA